MLIFEKIEVLQINKRAFKDLISKDGKKINLPALRIPAHARKMMLTHLPTVYMENSTHGAMLQAITDGNPLKLTQAPQLKQYNKHKPPQVSPKIHLL